MKTLKVLFACFLVSFIFAGVLTGAHADAPDTQGYVVKAGQPQGGILADPGDTEIWVYASETPEWNREHIQWAADNVAVGETVVLKAGDFFMADVEDPPEPPIPPSGYKIRYYSGPNHGNDQTVFITRSVKIIGEKDGSGNHLSKIVGGYRPFNIGVKNRPQSFTFYDIMFLPPEEAVDTTTQPLDVTIKDIEIIDPLGSGILIAAATGLNIEGNRFTDVRPIDIAGIWGVPHDPEAYGIILSTANCFADLIGLPGGTLNELTTGDITIVNNYFDGHDRGDILPDDDPWVDEVPLTEGYSLLFRGMVYAMRAPVISANLTIAQNTVSGAYNGFTSEDNLPCDGIGGNTLIDNNIIDLSERPSYYIPDPDPEEPPLVDIPRYAIEGVEGFWVFDPDPNIYGRTNLVVKNNYIKVRTARTRAEIAFINLSDVLFNNNTVEFLGYSEEDRTGVALWNTSNSVLSQNTMTGIAKMGFGVVFGSNNNVFTGNNLANLDAWGSEYGGGSYFIVFSDDNIVKGFTGGSQNVVDEGSNNSLTGVTPMTDTGIGQEISDAVQRLKDLGVRGGNLP